MYCLDGYLAGAVLISYSPIVSGSNRRLVHPAPALRGSGLASSLQLLYVFLTDEGGSKTGFHCLSWEYTRR